jgi:hypothetical protein
MLKALTLIILVLFATPACAGTPEWAHRGSAGGSVSPVVTPGGTQPAYNAGASDSTHLFLSNVAVNDLTPTYHGSSGDPNYNSRTFGAWDNPAFMLLTGTTQVGLFAHHSPTNTELKAGKTDNISSVSVRCDGGSWFTIPSKSANANAGGTVDWNFTVNPATWTDGLHKCDAVMIPTTGPDGIMNGPPLTPTGLNADPSQSVNRMMIDSGTRGVSGHILTIPTGASFNNTHGSTNTGVLGVGWSVSAYRVAPGTFIDGDSTHNQTSCAAESGSNCTGAGGVGTYHLTGPSQQVYGGVGTGSITTTTLTISAVSYGAFDLVALYGPNVTAGSTITALGSGTYLTGTYTTSPSQSAASGTIYASAPANFGYQRSFYFLTNANSTLPRAKVFVCQGTCNGVTGSDANAGTSAAPVVTISRAYKIGLDADSSTFFKGKFGLTVCLMNSGSNFVYSGGTWFGPVASWLGYVDIAAANSALCGLGADPGGEWVTNDNMTRNALPDPGNVAWHYVNFFGNADSGSPGDSIYYVADHVTQKTGLYGTNGIFGSGGYMCLESTSFFGNNGACPGTEMVRNTVGKYSVADGLHNTRIAVGNSMDGIGGEPMTWITGTYSTATPLVLTGITMPSDVTSAGNTLTSLFVGDGIVHSPMADFSNGCWNMGAQTVVSATSSTMTFQNVGQTDAGLCPNGSTRTIWGSTGEHSDLVQITGVPFTDVFYLGNSFNSSYPTAGQAPFFETILMDGVDHENNTYTKTALDVEKADAVNGANNNVTYGGNTWVGSTSFVHNLFVGGNTETFSGDKCVPGGSILPPNVAGTNQQSYAAATNPCYTTNP